MFNGFQYRIWFSSVYQIALTCWILSRSWTEMLTFFSWFSLHSINYFHSEMFVLQLFFYYSSKIRDFSNVDDRAINMNEKNSSRSEETMNASSCVIYLRWMQLKCENLLITNRKKSFRCMLDLQYIDLMYMLEVAQLVYCIICSPLSLIRIASDL